MRKSLLILRPASAALIAAVWLVASVSPAAARELTIRNFRSEIVVGTDGTLDVTETIQASFAGKWNGIYRTIPVEYRSPEGFNYTLLLDRIRITDDAGQNLRYETSREGFYRKFKIYVPGAEDATRTILLHYHVLDGLRFFEDHDELYWNVNGEGWAVPIQSASALIVLPSGVTGAHATAFTGGFGSRETDADIDSLGTGFEFKMRHELAFHEGLTVVVGWDKGIVKEPDAGAKIAFFLRSNWPLALPFLTFAAMFWLWWTRGRDPRHRSIAVQFEPPEQLTPGEVGTLVDNSADMRDITATLVDLAVRGYLSIEEKQKEHLVSLFSKKDYVFHSKKTPAEWAGLKSHELQLLAALFGNGAFTEVSLTDLHNQFYKSLPGIRNSIFDSLMEHHFYLHRPDNVRGGWIAGGIVVGVLLVLGGNALARAMGMQALPFLIAGVSSGIIICAFGWFMPAHTADGVRALEGALGFEDFLQHVEADRMERLEKTPALFEKFLPYAMALGVEKKWVTSFADIAKQPPSWYQGSYVGNFYAIGFVHDLNVMSLQAAAAMASAPRSSGGSGFGGGGFSGGGFGGGGGGGF